MTGWCLKIAIGKLPMMLGGRALLPSCNVRFEVSPFYGNTVNTSFLLSAITNSTSTITRDKQQKRSSHIAIAVSIPVIFVVLLLAGAFCSIYNRKAATPSPGLEEIVTVESLQYDFKTIRVATNNFSTENKLGQGGFGVVYRGTLQNGQEIAVKRLSSTSGQGIAEFKTEVLLVAKLQHKNLVRLLGFCLQAQEKLLVYEFLPNSSLDKVLLDPNKHVSLDWETRYKIIAGIARGVLYLHEDSRLKIIHRDLKSSNIMLDENMNPKISDFGLARLVGADQIQGDTNRIVGTYGYMAPEYAMAGRFSVKSVVYSFGVIVLEIVSGLKCNSSAFPFHEESLLQRAWRFGTSMQL
ncbi:cysteine-rich receptor-like protein kinase 5 [Chenopodium quinoa]|uniref:cysteine-rich receptor-like protein kinase 5 n=1 Tax=Chenopodium quinoa TaxID=63459 RepID=UPI000B79287E|nr:cysteine-rich receptor-like protein kinase 5 [Chenopodium quinoa]